MTTYLSIVLGQDVLQSLSNKPAQP
jgi:hypothetical protein